jgi:hypothetical protein
MGIGTQGVSSASDRDGWPRSEAQGGSVAGVKSFRCQLLVGC